MSKLKCICGNGMSSSDVPSKNIVYVFKEDSIKSTLEKTPRITLFDYETSEGEGFEYWYCTECKRFHVVENIPNGTVIKRYHPVDSGKVVFLGDMKTVYVFSAIEIYEAEEKNFEVSLGEYIKQEGKSHIYYVDASEEKVYKKTGESKGRLLYEIEK